MFNKQTAIGNLGADAEVRVVGEKRRVVKLSIAATHRHLNSNHEAVTHTEWFKAEFFCSESQAGYFERNFTKGALVFIEGRTHTDTYTANGEQQQSRIVKCDVDDVRLLKPAKMEQPASTTGTQQSQPANHQPEAKTSAPASMQRADLMSFD